jgi:GntR family transcriptional repressor for pyruvate dehydrogenase complex
VVTRAGRAGGSFVRRPDAGTLERNLHALVSGRGVRFRSLLEAREALEPAAARLAALHHTEADVRMLEESAARLSAATGDIPTFLQCNTDWHVAIATASHNEIIEAVVSSLSRVILRSTDIDEFNSASTMAVTLKAHDRILAAIRAGDGDRAAAAMSKHVHTYRELVETYDVPEDVRL